MHETVKDTNDVKKWDNEEHISVSESECDSEVIVKSDLDSDFDFDIECNEELDLLCIIFDDYGQRIGFDLIIFFEKDKELVRTEIRTYEIW